MSSVCYFPINKLEGTMRRSTVAKLVECTLSKEPGMLSLTVSLKEDSNKIYNLQLLESAIVSLHGTDLVKWIDSKIKLLKKAEEESTQ